MWYDRPCIENDVGDEPGHKFMCEFNVPDKQTGMENPNPQNCQDNDEEIDIASIGERNTVICQNHRPTNNPTENANIGTPTPPPRRITTTPPRRTTTTSLISQGRQLLKRPYF